MMDKIVSSYKIYRDGKYKECRLLFEELKNEYNLSIATKAKSSKDINDVEYIWSCIYENNHLVCKSLESLNMDQFNTVPSLVKSFLRIFQVNKCVPVYPLQLKLNLAYNYLYWSWIEVRFSNKSYQSNQIFNSMNSQLSDVVQQCKDGYIDHDLDDLDPIEKHSYLLKLLSNQVLKMKSLESIITLDIIHISLILLLMQCVTEIRFEVYEELLQSFIDNLENIRHHLKPDKKIPSINVSSKMGYFKFGWKEINSQLDLKYYNISISALCTTIIRMYINQKLYEPVADCINKLELLDLNKEFLFTFKYLKAFVCYHLDQLTECLYLLSQLHGSFIDEFSMARVMVLSGLAYSKQGKHQKAISEYELLQTRTNCCKPLVLYYIACEQKSLNYITSHIITLKQLVAHYNEIEGMKYDKNSYNTSECAIDYELAYMHLLHPQPEVTKCGAYYISAVMNLQTERYKDATSFYTDLLDYIMVNGREDYPSSVVSLPDTRFIYHEAALANMKSYNYDIAEKLCETIVESYYPHYTNNFTFHPETQMTPSKEWHYCLYHFEVDVIGLLLLSDIFYEQKNYNKQISTLNKCYNTVLEYMGYQTSTPEDDINDLSDETIFCRMLMSRILLRKAYSCIKLNIEDNIDRCFAKAFSYNRGDKDVVFCYKKWLLKSNRIDDANAIKLVENMRKLNLIDHPDYTIQYILHNPSEDIAFGTKVAVEDPNLMDIDEDDLIANLYED